MKESTTIISQDKEYDSHAGKKIRTINPPVFNGSTILFDSYRDLALANEGQYPGLTYGTDGLPPQKDFEQAICTMENGHLSRAFQSGISAITHTLQAFTKSGDHIIICDNVYWPTSNFCTTILTKFGVEVSYAPSAVGAEIEEMIRDNTNLIFMESPGSNTFEIQDIEAIVAIAQKHNIVTVQDGTWGTPVYHKALDLGVDISIQSVSKYISGHSDILLGTATTNEKHAPTLAHYYKTLEIFAPPQDCYMALRGLKTLAVRLAHHQKVALEVASHLAGHPAVDKVIHPALTEHPQHHRFLKYFTGSSGLFSFTLRQDLSEDQVATLIDSLKIFGIGYSWGGFKSLVTAAKYTREHGSLYAGKTVIRLSIGFEDVEDIIADLDQALSPYCN